MIAGDERHVIDGVEREVIVHRKGATRALPPDHPLVPAAYRAVLAVADDLGAGRLALTPLGMTLPFWPLDVATRLLVGTLLIVWGAVRLSPRSFRSDWWMPMARRFTFSPPGMMPSTFRRSKAASVSEPCKADNTTINSVADLRGKTVATQANSTSVLPLLPLLVVFTPAFWRK